MDGKQLKDSVNAIWSGEAVMEKGAWMTADANLIGNVLCAKEQALLLHSPCLVFSKIGITLYTPHTCISESRYRNVKK